MNGTIAKCYSHVNSNLRIPSHSTLLFTSEMDSRAFRKANLILLMADFDTDEAFAERVEKDVTYLRNIRNGLRGMGPRIARHLERKFGKELGWMDVPHATDPAALASWEAMLSVLSNLQESQQQKVLAAIQQALAAPHTGTKKAPIFSTLSGNRGQSADARNKRRTRR